MSTDAGDEHTALVARMITAAPAEDDLTERLVAELDRNDAARPIEREWWDRHDEREAAELLARLEATSSDAQ